MSMVHISSIDLCFPVKMRFTICMDILREVKKILNIDSKRKQKLKYALKNKKLLTAISKVQVPLRSNTAVEVHGHLEEECDSILSRKDGYYSPHLDIRTSKSKVKEIIGNVIIQNDKNQKRKLVPLVEQMCNQKKIIKSLKINFPSKDCSTSLNLDSKKLSNLFQESRADDTVELDLLDTLRHPNELKHVINMLPLTNVPLNPEPSTSHSLGEQNSFAQKNQKWKTNKTINNSVDIARISSESDRSSCITSFVKNCTSQKYYQKSENRIFCSLENLRRFPDRSQSKESSQTLTRYVYCLSINYSLILEISSRNK